MMKVPYNPSKIKKCELSIVSLKFYNTLSIAKPRTTQLFSLKTTTNIYYILDNELTV